MGFSGQYIVVKAHNSQCHMNSQASLVSLDQFTLSSLSGSHSQDHCQYEIITYVLAILCHI